jgi:acid stress chaperone HdeB
MRPKDKLRHHFKEAILKRTAVTLIALALSASWGARAQQFDLSTMTCNSFIKSNKDQMKLITAWLAGYYTDEDAAEVVDVSALNKLQDQLVTFCSRETGFPVASAADGILGHDSSTGATPPGASQSTP